MRTTIRAAALALTLAAMFPTLADARPGLSKRHARAEALAFVRPFVDLTDINSTVRAIMVPPRHCLQVNRATVACRFAFVLQPFGTVRGRAVVHRQRDGLLGIHVTPDLSDYWV